MGEGKEWPGQGDQQQQYDPCHGNWSVPPTETFNKLRGC